MKTVSEIQGEIAKLQEEMLAVQAECEHPLYEITMWSWRPGAFHPTRMCSVCRSQIPGINEEEIALVLAGFYGRK